MTNLSLEIQSATGKVLASHNDTNQVHLVYTQAYQFEDIIVLKCSKPNTYLMIQLEDSMGEAFIYMTGEEYQYSIPFAEKRSSYSPKSFTGKMHLLTARLATTEEIQAYRNVAYNPYDQHTNEVCYPHASANVETRGEAVFAARNAINGNRANHSHGEWPYESWGINQRPDAAITIHFGREVLIDQIALTLRADFPHDNYWERVTLTYSDGSSEQVNLVKTHQPQIILIEKKAVEWVALSELIQSDDPSPFPALTQFEVYGREV